MTSLRALDPVRPVLVPQAPAASQPASAPMVGPLKTAVAFLGAPQAQLDARAAMLIRAELAQHRLTAKTIDVTVERRPGNATDLLAVGDLTGQVVTTDGKVWKITGSYFAGEARPDVNQEDVSVQLTIDTPTERADLRGSAIDGVSTPEHSYLFRSYSLVTKIPLEALKQTARATFAAATQEPSRLLAAPVKLVSVTFAPERTKPEHLFLRWPSYRQGRHYDGAGLEATLVLDVGGKQRRLSGAVVVDGQGKPMAGELDHPKASRASYGDAQALFFTPGKGWRAQRFTPNYDM